MRQVSKYLLICILFGNVENVCRGDILPLRLGAMAFSENIFIASNRGESPFDLSSENVVSCLFGKKINKSAGTDTLGIARAKKERGNGGPFGGGRDAGNIQYQIEPHIISAGAPIVFESYLD